MTEHEQGTNARTLVNSFLRQKYPIEPPRRSDSRGLHVLLACTSRPSPFGRDLIETIDQPFVRRFPNPGPVFPCGFGEPVIERQTRNIEPEVGRALNIGVTAEYVGAQSRTAHVPCCQKRDAGRPYIGCADAVLRLPHTPDQG